MLLGNEIKADIKAARKIRVPWWGLLGVGIGAFLTSWLFDRIGRVDLVLPIMNVIFVLGFAIAVKWKLRRRTWFWGTMSTLTALHAFLIAFVPWPTTWIPAAVIAVIGSADLILMLAILEIVGKLVEGRNPEDD